MNFRHPVFLTLLSAIVLILIGLYFVERQRGVSPSGTSASWQTDGGYIETSGLISAPQTGDPLQVLPENTNPDTLSIPTVSTPTTKTPSASNEGTFDYNAMLAQMRRSSEQTSPSEQAKSTYEEMMSSFSFAPSIAPPAPKVKTPEQLALFAYGNVIGSRLQAFAAVNVNMSQTLTDQAKDRTSVSKGNALRDLGLRYKSLGQGILSMQEVPPSFESAHKRLGESYILLGDALRAVPDASDDQAFVAAITAYNNTADAYTNAFVSMVTLFSAHEVTFQDSDAGSAFSFRR